MRHKPLPPPPDDIDTVRDAQAAVPLVPGTEADCCARLQDRLELPGRDTAATWLAFLRGLGLAKEGPSGFSRSRVEPDDGELEERFLESVYGAREVLTVLRETDQPLDAEGVSDLTTDLVSPWERQRDGPDWAAVWKRRTRDLLDWFVLLGLAESSNDGYSASATD